MAMGGSGTSEATWLDIRQPPNDAVLQVMAHQQRLRKFLEALPTSINEMDSVQEWIVEGPPDTDFSRTRRKAGEVYVTYFRAAGPRQAGQVTLGHLPPGTFVVRWIDPSSGAKMEPESAIAGAENIQLSHPKFVDDLVLLVTANPPDLQKPEHIIADVKGITDDD